MTESEKVILKSRQLRDQGLYAEAYDCLQKLTWPQLHSANYLLKGTLERHLGYKQKALASLTVALAHEPHHGFACYELGELERSLGEFNRAAYWFVAALRSAPDHQWIHNSLHYTRFSDNLLHDIATAYAEHCQHHPEDTRAHYLLAEWQIRLGNRDAAIHTSRRAARLNLGAQQKHLASPEEDPTAPDFIIIGTPKGGTTSLLNWLSQHPQLWCHPNKELHFFNGAWEQGERWYASQFPRFQSSSHILRGEATPNYFLDPRVPDRVKQVAPKAHLILLLRNPLNRALSWIEHLRRFEGVQGSTEELLLAELNTLEKQPEKIRDGSAYFCVSGQALLGSCYDPPLARWIRLFQGQLLILSSEDLFQQPIDTMNICLKFLGISTVRPSDKTHLRPHNTNPLQTQSELLSTDAQSRIQQFLEEWNTKYHLRSRLDTSSSQP